MTLKLPKTEFDADNAETSRRSFLNWFWLGLVVAAVAEIGYVVFSFFRPHKTRDRSGGSGEVVEVGSVESFQSGSVTAFPRGQFYLCRLADGGFLAVSRKCTHLGCTVPWDADAKRFACPCHSSTFDLTGEVIRSPAPRALDIFPVRIENQVVYVNTRRPVKRNRFSQEQVVYPKPLT